MTIGPLPPRTDSTMTVASGSKPVLVEALGTPGFAEILRTVGAADERDEETRGGVSLGPAMRLHEYGLFVDRGGPTPVSVDTAGASGVADVSRAIDAPRDYAMRLNEYGLLANVGGIDAAHLSMAAPPTAHDVLLSEATRMDTTSPPAPPSDADPAEAASVARTGLGPVGMTATPIDFAAPASSSAKRPRATSSLGLATPRASSPLAGSTDERSIASIRTGRVRPTPHVAAKTPIRVAFNSGEPAAAVTVSAHGLTDRDADSLHADIVLLLRRHGLVIGDVRLNGRPMGQRQDRSGT